MESHKEAPCSAAMGKTELWYLACGKREGGCLRAEGPLQGGAARRDGTEARLPSARAATAVPNLVHGRGQHEKVGREPGLDPAEAEHLGVDEHRGQAAAEQHV